MKRIVFLLIILHTTLWGFFSTGDTEKNNIAVFEHNKPSVVYIATSRSVINWRGFEPTKVPRGTGSGFIWDTKGHIVTNYHVIAGADSATVTLSNGKSYPAKLIGYDKSHDLAVLKIKPPSDTKLRAIKKGDSANLKVGQVVYAIGNPFGLDWTMTSGIISALERNLYHIPHVRIRHAIQTDAAINPGNSGGPLLDSKGQVIGVNTALYSPTGSYAGIGFATPINITKRVVEQIITKGYYEPPLIGFYGDDRINRYIKRRYGIEGVAILEVMKHSDLTKHRIKEAVIYSDGTLILGDVITKVAGKRVRSMEEIATVLEKFQKGDSINLELVNNKQKRTVSVRLK